MRASSKSVPRKADYGKRALSSSEGEENETSDDESKSDKDNGEKEEPKSRAKADEKSTLKKRRKESALSLDLKDRKLASGLPSKDDSDAVQSEQQPINRKKSKVGAKRKPADLGSSLLSQELEDIKRRKFWL